MFKAEPVPVESVPRSRSESSPMSEWVRSAAVGQWFRLSPPPEKTLGSFRTHVWTACRRHGRTMKTRADGEFLYVIFKS